MNKKELLEHAVMTGTPREVAKSCKGLRKGTNLEWELALACRFGGLEKVKVLAEKGAKFRYTGKVRYYLAPLDIDRHLKDYAIFGIKRLSAASASVEEWVHNYDHLFSEEFPFFDKKIKKILRIRILPKQQRMEIMRYLCENGFDPSELLYYSIMCRDTEMTAALREMGVKLSEKRIASLTESKRGSGWVEFYRMLYHLDDDDCFNVVQNIVREIGDKKLIFPDIMLGYELDPKFNRSYYSDPEKFGFILEHFNQKQMNKTAVMLCTIRADSAACLKICTEHGWLTKPSDRDGFIECAVEENKTECLAVLLDYKNRNFDLAAEREKAERIARRKLNASPDSVTVLRELFSWKKQEDGTLVITNYKGTGDVIYVPPRIGRSAVTAIGTGAFSSIASRGKFPIKTGGDSGSQIRKIVLPDGIKRIGEKAFAFCSKLESINIPDSVDYIGTTAFSHCTMLEDIFIPDSVRKMGWGAFFYCDSLQSVRLSESMDEIPMQMFEFCRALRRITLPISIQRIGGRAFAKCESLEEIVIPASVTEIDQWAFSSNIDTPITAVVEAGSYAEEYCKKNGIPFRHA